MTSASESTAADFRPKGLVVNDVLTGKQERPRGAEAGDGALKEELGDTLYFHRMKAFSSKCEPIISLVERK